MTVAQTLEFETTGRSDTARWWPAARRALAIVGVLLAVCLLWEGYRALGMAIDNNLPCGQSKMPVCPNDRSMPHLWTIMGALIEPVRSGSDEQILLMMLIKAALFTWREAATGFVLGSLIGFALGAVFGRFLFLERGLMPYIVASQTVPLLAIAPMVVIWGGRLNLPAWAAVSIISAYLTFFPVTINTLRGLRSPNPTAVELMRSYAASEMQILWKLRLPAALPYIFTALKVSATASVIGAIVGELPTGIADGLGRVLLSFSYFFTLGPEKLYAAILGSALLGIVFAAIIALAERLIVPEGRRLAE
ncbi:MAG TPA: ABC transporter permease [Anaerolineales bacterium]|nr:ABC transporter permease [Anaerolineales bacterium]